MSSFYFSNTHYDPMHFCFRGERETLANGYTTSEGLFYESLNWSRKVSMSFDFRRCIVIF